MYQENILSDFLTQYEAEVKQMILGGRTQEEIMQVRLKCQREEVLREVSEKIRKEAREEIFTSMLLDGIELERAARIAKVPMERAKELAAGLNCRV